jgi:hypothetical protein
VSMSTTCPQPLSSETSRSPLEPRAVLAGSSSRTRDRRQRTLRCPQPRHRNATCNSASTIIRSSWAGLSHHQLALLLHLDHALLDRPGELWMCSALLGRCPMLMLSDETSLGLGTAKDRRGPENRMGKPTCTCLPDTRIAWKSAPSKNLANPPKAPWGPIWGPISML